MLDDESAQVAKKITYMQRLKAHPGVPIASIVTAAFIFSGIANEGLTTGQGVLVGLAASLVAWLPVLITARTQPVGR